MSIENFTYSTCSTVEVQKDDSPRNVIINVEEFETVPTFSSLRGLIGPSRGFADAATACVH